MGCHRHLLFCSPAKSLGLRVCHSFCNPHIQPLSLRSSCITANATIPSLSQFPTASCSTQQEPLYPFHKPFEGALVYPFALCRCIHSATLHFSNRISNPHLPLVSLPRSHTQIPFNQPQVFPTQFQHQQKHAPNPCAYCIGHSHSLPAVLYSHPRSTRRRLAAFHSASLHCFPPGIHSTCYPHSKKPMKIFTIAKDFVDEVISLSDSDF